MAVNARTEEFQHIEVFDKPALFTNGRIARDTVPKGWYCYDIRGSDDDPGELCYLAHYGSGSVLCQRRHFPDGDRIVPRRPDGEAAVIARKPFQTKPNRKGDRNYGTH